MVRREPLGARRRQHVVGVLVVPDLALLLLEPRLVRLVQPVAKHGVGLEHVLLVEVRHEARAHNGPVRIRDIAVADDVVDLHHDAPAAQARERGGEQEEAYASLQVEFLNLRQNRERGIVDNAASFGILESLVVPSLPERAHYGIGLDAPALAHVFEYDCVYLWRRDAIVRGLLRLKLLYERGVVPEALLRLAHRAPLSRLEHVPPSVTWEASGTVTPDFDFSAEIPSVGRRPGWEARAS